MQNPKSARHHLGHNKRLLPPTLRGSWWTPSASSSPTGDPGPPRGQTREPGKPGGAAAPEGRRRGARPTQTTAAGPRRPDEPVTAGRAAHTAVRPPTRLPRKPFACRPHTPTRRPVPGDVAKPEAAPEERRSVPPPSAKARRRLRAERAGRDVTGRCAQAQRRCGGRGGFPWKGAPEWV